MIEVDPAFIQPQEHRPKPKILQAEGIPIIDLSILNFSNPISDPDALEGLVEETGSACKKWGFFQVINHGVPLDKRQKVENASRKFFCQPLEEKRKVRRDEASPMGYYETEHTKNVRDWKEVFDFTVENPTLFPASYLPEDKEVRKFYNQWPENPPELSLAHLEDDKACSNKYWQPDRLLTEISRPISQPSSCPREAAEEYAREVEKLAHKLLELIAMSLGLPANRFRGFFKDQTSSIRLNHYPPCPVPHLALGVGRHKDPGALTILAQDDVGGLQVKSKTDGEWIWVKPAPDAYVINVGDIIQVWSNDAYESVEHRVMVNPEKERFSIPFFFNPAHHTVVEPVKELLNEQNPAKYMPYNWGKFSATRKRGNFMKLDVENIQIYHFKIAELADKLDNSTIH